MFEERLCKMEQTILHRMVSLAEKAVEEARHGGNPEALLAQVEILGWAADLVRQSRTELKNDA